MPRLLESRRWQRDCQAVIVGFRPKTGTVERIWVLKDGGMLFRGLVHYPPPGRTAVGEAITTFRLCKLHRFPVSKSRQATAYAAMLERTREPDADVLD